MSTGFSSVISLFRRHRESPSTLERYAGNRHGLHCGLLGFSESAIEIINLRRQEIVMPRKHETGFCEHCKKSFAYCLVHNGFNESSYAYCDRCGMTALLSGWKVPKGVQMPSHQNISAGIESLLQPCKCGGAFKAGASPRCLHCKKPLSATQAAEYIEAQAEGTRKGWRWQRSWTDLYCIIIEDNVMRDVWKNPEA